MLRRRRLPRGLDFQRLLPRRGDRGGGGTGAGAPIPAPSGPSIGGIKIGEEDILIRQTAARFTQENKK